jgi:3-deoxy-D-manno-octulosonate 8-phosphate phosphatase (KDO 8-P phosphatase)
MNLLERLSRIKMLVFDMDGVLTNGKIMVLPDGQWVRTSDIKDGYAIQHAVKSKLIIAIITGSQDSGMASRLLKLGVSEFYQHVVSKSEVLSSLMDKYGLVSDEVLFMGDDMPDLEAFAIAGIKACPSNAASELLSKADFISTRVGGDGCVREIIEKVLKIKGKWGSEITISSI